MKKKCFTQAQIACSLLRTESGTTGDPRGTIDDKYHSRAHQYTPSRQRIRDLALSRTGRIYRLSKLGYGITTQRLVRVAELTYRLLARGKYPPTPEKEATARLPSCWGVTVHVSSF